DFRDSVRRLAAVLAGDSGAWIRPWHAGADVLARREPPGLAQARQAPAHHAVPHLGAARRRTIPGLGFAWRRPARPVDDAVLPAPGPWGPQSSGGDRRAGLALRALPDLILAPHGPARRAGHGKPRPA